MRRWTGVALASVLLAGCAQLLGASYDDARIATDAGVDADPFADVANTFGDGEADADDADLGDAAVDPMTLGPIGFWFSGDYGITTKDGGTGITKWASHVGTIVGTGTSVYTGPLDPPSFVPQAQNGLGAVRFDSAKLQYFSTGITGPKGKDLSLFVVAKGNPIGAVSWSQGFSTPFAIFPWGDAKKSMGLYMYGENFGQAPSDDGRWSVWEIVYEAAKLQGARYFYNGVPGDVVTSQRVDLPDQTLYLGGSPFTVGSQYFTDAIVGEVLFYAAALTPLNRKRLEIHLAQRWGFKLGP